MKRLKILHKTAILLILLFAFFAFSKNRVYAGDYLQIPGLIDIKTSFGDGAHDLESLVRLAKERGFHLLFINDHDRMTMKYGLFPFRFILTTKIERPSINSLGAENYLRGIREIEEKYPDMVLIPGTESAPHYYWEGSLFKRNLTAHNWEKHLLIMGLEKPEDYKNLPILHNGFSTAYRNKNIIIFSLVFLFLLSILFLIRWKKISKGLGLVFLVISIIYLINNPPFVSSPFDQYSGDQGQKPYQLLIDYVHSRGGMTFWNHPETKSGISKKDPIYVKTPPYPEVLEETNSYTGFASVYGVNTTITEPGGEWDRVLQEYCRGKRARPAFGISTADFHEEGWAGDELGKYPTIFLVKKFNKESILKALRNGKMYAYSGDYRKRVILDTFRVTAPISGKSGASGDEILAKGPVTVHITVRTADDSSQEFRLRLVRAGRLIRVFKGETPFKVHFRDHYYNPGEKAYYRLDIKGGGLLVSNPIFVQFTQ